MKFVLVGPVHPFRGGIAQYTTSLFRALVSQHEALLISFSRQYPSLIFPGRTQHDESLNPFKAPHEAILDSMSPGSWTRVAQRILEYGPEAMIFQWWQPFFAPAYVGVLRKVRRKASIPVLFLCHNVLSHDSFPVPAQTLCERMLTRKAFERVDGFLVHAEAIVGQLRQFNRTALVRKIYHPLYDFYLEWDQATMDVPQRDRDTLRLLFFGKVRKYKGLTTFLEALAIVKDEVSVRALIAGEFYVASESYRRAARKLSLEDIVDWREHYIPNEQVPGLFRAADLVVLPYKEATQSGVVPVAYRFDVPVVATNVGGLSEVVLDGKTGYLVPVDDPRALARKIIQYHRQNKKEEFQENIREFRIKLSWQQVVDNTVDLLEALRRERLM